MKFTIFRSDKGDCLLLTSDGGTRILADGGMSRAYSKHVAPNLGNTPIDLVYLSHIDQDHVAGILQFMDDTMAWRVHDYQKAQGLATTAPKVKRPPLAKRIWHNAFHDQASENTGDITRMLAASAELLAGGPGWMAAMAAEHGELAQSQKEAMQLVRRVSPAQLNIPVNLPNHKLMLVRSRRSTIRLGDLAIRVIGPFQTDLEILRDKWNDWLEANKAAVKKLRDQGSKDEHAIGNEVPRLLRNMAITAETFGDRGSVTPPNLASLMLHIDEQGKSCVMTGDGHYLDILKGLKHQKLMNRRNGEGAHVTVLKGQHHLSEHNWHEDFAKAVTADHYIVCGNGMHANPDLGVVEMLLNSRVGPADKRSQNPEWNKPFTLWFNSSSSATDSQTVKSHMKKVETMVKKAARDNPGRITAHFLPNDDDSFGFSV